MTRPQSSYQTSSKTAPISNAAEALRNILQKLPIHKAEALVHKNEHESSKEINQYEIPDDPAPVPYFKPLPLVVPNHLTSQALPLMDSLTQTHTITTAFNQINNENHNNHIKWLNQQKPYNVYHTMKYTLSPPPLLPSNSYSNSLPNYPQSNELVDNQIHQQQLNQVQHIVGPGQIEIQKSLTYEIQDPALVQRRLENIVKH